MGKYALIFLAGIVVGVTSIISVALVYSEPPQQVECTTYKSIYVTQDGTLLEYVKDSK